MLLEQLLFIRIVPRVAKLEIESALNSFYLKQWLLIKAARAIRLKFQFNYFFILSSLKYIMCCDRLSILASV